MRFRAITLAVGLAGLTACNPDKAPEQAPEQPKADAAPQAKAPEPPSKSHADCVGPIATGEAKKVQVGRHTWELNGSTLEAPAAIGKNGLTLGVITDIKENSEENLANIDEFIKFFSKKKVDAIVVAGDTGLNKEQIVGALEAFKDVKVPVFNIAGNREGKSDYTAAMAEVSAKHPHIMNLNVIRHIDTPVADLVSMPGYFNPSYIHAEDGCQYFQADVDAMVELAKTADSPVILVSHGGPKSSGTAGIDRTAEGSNVGDPMLTKAIIDAKIPFGIFGNIHEAGGRATNLEGTAVLEAGKSHESLYLNPGPADGVRWIMNDESESVGMAAILTVDKGGKASFEIMRITDSEAKLAKGEKKGKRGKKKAN